MLELELEEAKSLFLSYTKLKENEVDQELLKECLKRCYFSSSLSSTSSSDGKYYHPLALRELGSQVGEIIRQGMTTPATMERRIATFNLSRKKEHRVFSILRSSFDSLKKVDRLLFLVIALVLPLSNGPFDLVSPMEWLGMVLGKEADEILQMVECLKRRSLLESFDMSDDSDYSFSMHDLWREFGVWLEFDAEEVEGGQGNARRLYTDEKCNGRVDLTEFKTLEVVKLKTNFGNTEDVAVDVRGLKHLKSLEVIGHRGEKVVKVNGLGTLKNLTYLRWWHAASNACIAELRPLRNLQVVDLEGFRGDKLPNMSKWTNLRGLHLSWSYSLQSINLRHLTNLANLNLCRCTSLESVELGDFGGDKVPDMGKLTSLRFLDLSGCESLQSINLRNLTNLTRLFLGGCTRLRSLDITGCSSIKEVKGLDDKLVSLEELRAAKCESLAGLRFAQRPPKLRVLEIEPEKVPARVWKGNAST